MPIEVFAVGLLILGLIGAVLAKRDADKQEKEEDKMKRKIFAIMEGERLPDGRTLDVGSLYIDDAETDRLPVTWANDNALTTPIGWAHDFQRIEHEDHGDLSMVIVMNDDAHQDMLDNFEVYPFATNVEEEVWDTNTGERQVHRARIRMLQLVPIPGIPFGVARRLTHHDV